MKILAITRLTGADLAPHLEEEQRVAAEWRADGFIIESHRLRDRSGTVFTLNADDAGSAEARMRTLPFVSRGVLVLDQFLELAD